MTVYTYLTTLNPSDKSANITLSGGDLIATLGTAGDNSVRATIAKANGSGKYYFEMTTGLANGGNAGGGLTPGSSNLAAIPNAASPGLFVYLSGAIWLQGSNTGLNAGSFATQTMGFAIDRINKKVWCRSGTNWNGQVIGSQNPATNTGGVSIAALDADALFPVAMLSTSGKTISANFGASSFALAVPSGFVPGWPDTEGPDPTGRRRRIFLTG